MRPISFGRFTEEALTLYRPPIRASQTYRAVRQVLGELAELPGVRTTAALRAPTLAAWIQAHPDRSPARTASLLRTLAPLCRYAVVSGYLDVSPFAFRSAGQWVRDEVLAPECPNAPRHLNQTQVAALLAHTDREASKGSWQAGRLQALVYLLAFLGLRKSEALHLKPEDIDLTRKTMTIRPRRSWRPKTRRSAATLPLPDLVVDVLRLWLPRCGGVYVFPGLRLKKPWTGGPAGKKAIDAVKAAGHAVGIPNLTIAAFRKTIVTLAKVFGLSPRAVMALLRHTNLETQGWYDEDDVEILRAATSKIRYG